MRNTAVRAAVRLSLLPFAVGFAMAGTASSALGATISLSFDPSCTASTGSGTITITCGTSAPPPGTPSCSPSGASISSGQTATLSANCSGGTAPLTITWLDGTGTTVVGSGPSFTTPALTVSTTYKVSVIDTKSTGGGPFPVTVNVSASGGGGGGTVPTTCNGLKVINAGALPFDGTPSTPSGFGSSSMVIATLNVPAGFPSTKSNLSVFEFASNATYETAWLSKAACDPMPTKNSASSVYTLGPNLYFSIGGTFTGTTTFQPGETWYLHVVNQNYFGKSTCSVGSCDIGIKVYPPK